MHRFDMMGFGEAMLRLSPAGALTIEQSTQLSLYPAGSELNVLCGASRLGLRTSFLSRLGSSPMGRYIANKAREQGVDTSFVQYTDDRQGLYFFENGTPPRPGMAYYDRRDSGMARVDPADFDWNSLLAETRLFLTSGITAALSSSAAAAVTKAVETAASLEQTRTVFDINYRSKLWTAEQALKTLEPLLQHVDILLLSGGDAEVIFGLDAGLEDDLSRVLCERYGIDTVCVIYGPKDRSALWKISCFSQGQFYGAAQQGPLQTVDRLGAGDSFAAGFLTGYLEEGPGRGAAMGSAMMSLKNTFHGDITWASREQVQAIMEGSRSMLQR